ncbi:MAG: DUF445 domain-containing protein [Myxococcota bacterium]|nr:DUF445 domain-containing protein [Myxococcota bacterium]
MGIIDRIAADWLVLTIPVVSAFIGWFTNLVAIKMMFYPTEFVGIRPFLGWQGIVPANARRLAKMSTRLILTKLLSLEELFAPFKGEAFAKNLAPVVEEITQQVIDEVATKRAPMMWQNAGEFMQNQIRDKIREEVRGVAIKIVDDFSKDITEILDLEKVVVEAIEEDKRLMSLMFLQVGSAEFKFIEVSGAYFGFLFGIPQMLVWVYYPADWSLPLAGFVVGYATNWIALRMIFSPREPKKFGPFTLHGLFHKRQKEVSAEFSKLTAGKVLNADNITKTVTQGPSAEKIRAIVENRVNELIDKYLAHPMAAMLVPEADRPALREELLGRIQDELPKPGGLLHTFAGKAVDIGDEIQTRMEKLPPDEFEGVLRPAFQQDEWKLILAGAVLGVVAGALQVLYVFS